MGDGIAKCCSSSRKKTEAEAVVERLFIYQNGIMCALPKAQPIEKMLVRSRIRPGMNSKGSSKRSAD
jgi:hypothetical protein